MAAQKWMLWAGKTAYPAGPSMLWINPLAAIKPLTTIWPQIGWCLPIMVTRALAYLLQPAATVAIQEVVLHLLLTRPPITLLLLANQVAELKAALNSILRGHVRLTYSQVWDALSYTDEDVKQHQ